ncbi:MAG TPA: DUF5916 domain-containing protein, partial [Bacteroidales bacterium]|nr:DUF5916 domain-containing protein [Bacteroidales bacterium]
VTPIIDGLMDEDCWNLVEWGGGFIQSQPEENKPPSQETAFKILYDNNNLYVFIRAFDTEPGKISRIMSRRDNFDGDMVEINIDSYFDKQTAFSFTATAAGVKGDELVTEDGNNWDDSWNPVWYLATSSDSLGWCAEMRIPFSQIRFGKKTEHIWGLQVMRHIYRLSERSTWQYIPKGSPGSIHLFGELHGIKNIKPQHKAELLPYLVAKAERFGKVEGDPFLTGKSSSVNAGLDGKIALTNDFTLDFSINPDFGQVEADPSEVNLTAFETYFSERRPFFIEGKNIFQFMPNQTIVIHNMYSDNLFYSRRIGRYPQYYPSVSENVAVKMPESTTILGAMKISGKTKNGLSVGIMESLTANENAVTDSLGVRNKVSVEPLTNYFAGRIKKDFNKGETVLGGIITSVNRKITNPDLYFLNNSAYTAGLDFQHNWKDRTWYIAGNTEVSNINGKPEAITSEQTSSARYFQRPDASYLSVDSSRTSLSGYGATVKLGRSSKKKIQFETSVTLRSPGLEFNDIGYMRYSDIIHHGTWVAYYIRNPFAIFNNFYLNTNYWIYWNFGGKLLSTNANVNFNSQFKNRWRINGSFTRRSENISTNLLRGGPSFIMPGDQGMNLNLTTDQSRKFSAGGGFYTGSRDVKSRKENSFWGSLFYRPLNNLSFSVEPEYDITDDMLQYVTTAGPSGEPVYIFGELNQKTLSFTLRVNFTINPELSLEYYGQPFISAGKYSKFKKITMPHAGSFSERFHEYSINEIMYNGLDNTYSVSESGNTTADYSFGNPDYNFGQFRSNMVIRWEYTPGSTLFLVWSQGRTNSSARGLFSYTNDMKDLFNIVPRNIFLLKFSYWFSL